MATTRPRLDRLLVTRGLAGDLREAGALILAGDVRVAGARVRTPGTPVAADADVSVARQPYVSRGGHKLAAALDGLGVAVEGVTALDAGASTGGFTDCLLQRGAACVHAVDVGHGLLAWKVRSDPRVRVHERTHVDRLATDALGGPVDLLTADLSFISLRRVLPALAALVRPGGRLLLMVKPQFEARRDEVPAGGVLRDGEGLHPVRVRVVVMQGVPARIQRDPRGERAGWRGLEREAVAVAAAHVGQEPLRLPARNAVAPRCIAAEPDFVQPLHQPGVVHGQADALHDRQGRRLEKGRQRLRRGYATRAARHGVVRRHVPKGKPHLVG